MGRLQIAEKENLKNKQLATLKSKLNKAGANTGTKEHLNGVKKIKIAYEKQVKELTKKMASLEKSKKEHELQKKRNAKALEDISNLKAEIGSMKRQRANLIKQQSI